MQASLRAFLLVCALGAVSTTCAMGLCDYLLVGPPCGCDNPNCCDGCEPNRWIDGGCGCEVGCGCEASCCCEPACGCGSSRGCGDCCGAYCVDGRKFAGRSYNCGCDSYMPTRGCTGPACCDSPCGCGDCCEPGCGLEASCGCGDCCEPSCGCGDCGCKKKSSGCAGMLSACGRMCSALCGGGSCGCSGETYWSEWHNDPPRCCDPCNRCGQWVGPPSGGGCGCGGCNSCGSSGCGCNGGGYDNGGYGNSYDGGNSPYASNRPTGAASRSSVATRRPVAQSTSAAVARRPPNPYRPTQSARKPQQGAKQQVQR
jgi:hypothetical protein